MTDQQARHEPGKRLQKMDTVLNGVAGCCRVLTGVSLVVLTVIFGWLVFGRYVLKCDADMG